MTNRPPAIGFPPSVLRHWPLAIGYLLTAIGYLVVPYLLAWARQGVDWVFSGFLFGVEDGFSYLAKMRLGASGFWLFRTPYTLEPQGRYAFFGPYLLLGHLVPGARVGVLVALFHFFRLVAAGLLAWAWWTFLSHFLQGRKRHIAWIMGLLGGGLGWVPLLGRGAEMPLSWYSPEGFGFLMVMGIPHLALARAGVLALLTALLTWAEAEGRGAAPRAFWVMAATGLGTLALGWVHPLALVTLGTLAPVLGLTLWLAARRTPRTVLVAGAGMALGALPWAVYILSLQRDPFIQSWSAQNRLPTPSWVTLAWAYAWVLPWAVVGGRRLARERPWRAAFLVWWVAEALLLAHVPYPIRRRFLEGIWLALSVLVAASGERAARVPLVLSLVSTGLFWAGLVQRAIHPGEPVFLPRSEVAALEALAARAQPDDGVLAAYATGNVLPAWAPVRVPLGLGPESAHWPLWEKRVRWAFQADTNDAARRAFLAQWDIRFVFYGPHERQLGAWCPETSPYLQKRYAQNGYGVYEVLP